ncbi:unnamed protein product [Euphydryas editha]|uniref:Uncharacterized protein n=1 Tax=Euphydryas editha TaxID=104508 RepID=A0AAU9V6W2_EUPED|nr:unnamed protein product [Euphydryas editha]
MKKPELEKEVTIEIGGQTAAKTKFHNYQPEDDSIEVEVTDECIPNDADETELLIGNICESITGKYIVYQDNGRLVKLQDQEEQYEVNKYCVFQDEGSLFPGRITKICQSPFEMLVSCLNKRFEGGWTWPENPDITKITD